MIQEKQDMSPSPQVDFLVVMLRTLVGILTGPFTLMLFSLAALTRSEQTIAKKNKHDISSRARAYGSNIFFSRYIMDRRIGFIEEGLRCNNPNFWEIEINGFIKISNFGDNKNFYF
jgi:hypothetical protein